MITYKRESFDEWLADARLILPDHQKESGEDYYGSALDINHDFYLNLEVAGALHIICGRNEHKELVAYWIGSILPNINYKSLLTVYSSAYWVRKDYRGFTVYRLFKFINQYLTNLNVHNILINVKLHNSLGGILGKLGYRKIQEVYTRVINDA